MRKTIELKRVVVTGMGMVTSLGLNVPTTWEALLAGKSGIDHITQWGDLEEVSKRGSQIFKRNFNRAKEVFWGKPFIRAATFEKAYLTDMLQDLVSMGIDVHCVIIERGWREIDTVEDYENALKIFEK